MRRSRRPGLGGHSALSWAAKKLAFRPGYDAIDTTPTVIPDPPPRIHHPVIRETHPTWYRVMRGFWQGDVVNWECVGEFPTALEATTFVTREIGHCVIWDWHGKPYSRNGQPIEVRA